MVDQISDEQWEAAGVEPECEHQWDHAYSDNGGPAEVMAYVCTRCGMLRVLVVEGGEV